MYISQYPLPTALFWLHCYHVLLLVTSILVIDQCRQFTSAQRLQSRRLCVRVCLCMCVCVRVYKRRQVDPGVRGLGSEITLPVQGSGEGHVIECSRDGVGACVWCHAADTVFRLIWWELTPQLVRQDIILFRNYKQKHKTHH